VDYTADQALAATAAKSSHALDRAKEFLTTLLKDGPVDSIKAKEACLAHMISSGTLREAYDELGVIAKKKGLTEGWEWRLK
jgi:hypothetical protein